MISYQDIRVAMTKQEIAALKTQFAETYAGPNAEAVQVILDNDITTRGRYAEAKRDLDSAACQLANALVHLQRLHEKCVIELADTNFDDNTIPRLEKVWAKWHSESVRVGELRTEYRLAAENVQVAYVMAIAEAIDDYDNRERLVNGFRDKAWPWKPLMACSGDVPAGIKTQTTI